MKRCRECDATDPLAFAPSRKTICKQCANAEVKAWRLANPERERARQRKWIEENPEKKRAKDRRWQKKNPDKNAAKTAKNRASKLQRTPAWVDKEFEPLALEELYCCSRERTAATGVSHEVDHILPMQGKKVTGFHLASNMQVITELENRIKSNRYEPSEGIA